MMVERSFVWAEDQAGWIGKANQIPWQLPVDLKHFKALTVGKPMIMGYQTWLSIGRILPDRENVVITHRKLAVPGLTVLNSIAALEQLLQTKWAQTDVAIIGGAELFRQTISLATVLERTVVAGDFHGDKKMPPINYDEWTLVQQKSVISQDEAIPNCQFQRWERLDVEEDGKIH